MAALVNREMQEVMLALTAGFPDASNLMGAVFRFIRACLFWEQTLDAAVERFVPAMTAEACEKTRTAASAHCFRILDELNRSKDRIPELDLALKKVDMFAEFCRTALPRYRRIMQNDYGGTMERVGMNPGLVMF
jgi:hypothetical protein